MKRMVSCMLVLALILTLVACAAPADEPETSTVPTAKPAPETYTKPVTAEQYFRHIAEGERVLCDGSPYSNTESDGSFVLPCSYVDGTPYSFHSILFDPAFFTGKSVTVSYDGDGAPGSGSTSSKFVFTPIAAGDTEIMLVTDNMGNDTLECRVFNLTVREENGGLRCALNWYEDGIMGEQYELCAFSDPASTEIPADE